MMKSKAEIIDALKCHMRGDCSECSYREGWHTCNPTLDKGLFADILTLLIKSDFEVIKEILDRSKLSAEGRVGYYNQHDWSIISLDGYEEVDLEFDSEGNIL